MSKSFKDANPQLIQLSTYLLDHKASGIPELEGSTSKSTHRYFQVKDAIAALLSPTAPQIPGLKAKDPANARKILHRLAKEGFIVPVQIRIADVKVKNPTGQGPTTVKKTFLIPSSDNSALDDMYYAWLYEGPKTRQYIIAFGILAVIFILVLFPAWPYQLRIGALYLLSALLVALLAISFFVKPLAYYTTKYLASSTLVILPNVDNNDLGLLQSFKPLYQWESNDKQQQQESKASKEAEAKSS